MGASGVPGGLVHYLFPRLLPEPHAMPKTPKSLPRRSGATYASAGVDIDAGDRVKKTIQALARGTFNRQVIGGTGGFGGLFALDTAKFPEPVLVSSADGVGTKLKLAFELGIHDTVGADLVNHCVNDIAVQGATPLFFLDYLATGRIEGKVLASVVRGLAGACLANRCTLIGGETAQMPGFYADGEYDLAGFIVGAVPRNRLITGSGIRAGDALVGFPSTGLHTNGYSLARKLFFDTAGYRPGQHVRAIGEKVGTALMKVHRSYLSLIQRLTRNDWTVGMAHITGGGITDNLPRILPRGLAAAVDRTTWTPPRIFTHLAEIGSIGEEEMLRTFNMGIGLIAVVPAEKLRGTQAMLRRAREPFHLIGRVVQADGGRARVIYQ